MPTITHTSQVISDLYYQSYASDESFLEVAHFRYLIAGVYNSILVRDYTASKQENQAETGYIFPTISDDLIVSKDYDTKVDGEFKFAEIDGVVSFPYDQWGYGIVSVRCGKTNKACGPFERTTASMKRKLCIVPFSPTIWFWRENNRLYLYSSAPIPESISVNIVPSIDFMDEDAYIPTSYETLIINTVMTMLKQAANGAVVDTANNSNPNEVMQTVIDNVFRNIKTKAQ